MGKFSSSQILYTCVLIVVLSSILTTIMQNKQIQILKKSNASAIIHNTAIQSANTSLLNVALSMIELNGINKDFIQEELSMVFPSSLCKTECIYVLISRIACSSCLNQLMDRLLEANYPKDNVYFLLEEENTFMMNEIKAETFTNITIDRSVFDFFEFPYEIGILLGKKNKDKILLTGYDAHIDNTLYNTFINTI